MRQRQKTISSCMSSHTLASSSGAGRGRGRWTDLEHRRLSTAITTRSTVSLKTIDAPGSSDSIGCITYLDCEPITAIWGRSCSCDGQRTTTDQLELNLGCSQEATQGDGCTHDRVGNSDVGEHILELHQPRRRETRDEYRGRRGTSADDVQIQPGQPNIRPHELEYKAIPC